MSVTFSCSDPCLLAARAPRTARPSRSSSQLGGPPFCLEIASRLNFNECHVVLRKTRAMRLVLLLFWSGNDALTKDVHQENMLISQLDLALKGLLNIHHPKQPVFSSRKILPALCSFGRSCCVSANPSLPLFLSSKAQFVGS